MSQNISEETTGKWPCPQEAADIPLKTIAKIMNEFNISIKEYMKDRLHYIEESRKRGCTV